MSVSRITICQSSDSPTIAAVSLTEKPENISQSLGFVKRPLPELHVDSDSHGHYVARSIISTLPLNQFCSPSKADALSIAFLFLSVVLLLTRVDLISEIKLADPPPRPDPLTRNPSYGS